MAHLTSNSAAVSTHHASDSDFGLAKTARQGDTGTDEVVQDPTKVVRITLKICAVKNLIQISTCELIFD